MSAYIKRFLEELFELLAENADRQTVQDHIAYRLKTNDPKVLQSVYEAAVRQYQRATAGDTVSPLGE